MASHGKNAICCCFKNLNQSVERDRSFYWMHLNSLFALSIFQVLTYFILSSFSSSWDQGSKRNSIVLLVSAWLRSNQHDNVRHTHYLGHPQSWLCFHRGFFDSIRPRWFEISSPLLDWESLPVEMKTGELPSKSNCTIYLIICTKSTHCEIDTILDIMR